MKCNVGGADRLFRVLLGLMILALGFLYESPWGLVGIIPLLTAVFGWCPLYLPMRFSSCKKTPN